MATIQDGLTGKTARVTDANELMVRGAVETIDFHSTNSHQKYWSLPFEDIDPTAADDYFFYLKNTGTTDLSIPDIRISTTVAGAVQVHWVSGTAGGAPTDLTPVNRYLGSPNVPVATIQTDPDITGLTNLGELFRIDLDVTGRLVHLHTTGNIVIPPAQAIALIWDQATGVLSGSVTLNGQLNGG
jgi:hypothetical protein